MLADQHGAGGVCRAAGSASPDAARSFRIRPPADVPQVVSPLNFANEPLAFDRAPPLLGEHTDEILRELRNSLAEQLTSGEPQMARLHLPSVDEMTPEQRDVHDEIVSGVRGRLVGPLRAVIHSPDLARRWSRLGEYLRFSTCLPKKLNELAIIVTGRRWNSQLEFHIHAEAAKAAGLDPACIEAIRVGRSAGIRRRGGGRGLRVRPPAAADRQRRRRPCTPQ